MEFLISWGRQSMVVLLAAAIPAALAWAILAVRRSEHVPMRSAIASATIDVGLVLSLFAILFVGLRPGPGIPGGWEQWNIVPFRDLILAVRMRPWGLQEAVIGVVGNTLLFVPFGFFVALRYPAVRWTTLALVGLGLGAAIELAQALMGTGRASDITDVITNATGALIGIAAARALSSLGHRGVADPGP